ncbi:MAG TPA: RtcB family protein, partial [Candidatus Nanoarchaeia archaeon]|nr:RtcB family protein [Candidatus Nanoarchaeia archaeon]
MKEKLRKISDYEYVLEKDNEMNVSGKVIMNEKLFSGLETDSISQLRNVCCMPGVVDPVIALPDAHIGYGLPMGAVASFDLKEGVISSGLCGFDINCLEGNSQVLHEFGYHKSIKNYESSFKNDKLVSMNPTSKVINTDIALFLKKKNNGKKVFKIKTEFGNEIVATEDHPLFSKKGIVKLSQLDRGDEISYFAFKGVDYEEPQDFIIVDLNDIKKENSRIELIEKELLPLKSTNPKLPYLLKILAYILGDGHARRTKEGYSSLSIYSADINELYPIQKDLEYLGYNSHIYTRERNHELNTYYGVNRFSAVENCLRIGRQSLFCLFEAMGLVIGDKVHQEFLIPSYLFKLPLWQKRLFLACFFGAELSSPKTETKRGYNFYGPVLSLNKSEQLRYNLKMFLEQIKGLLCEFGVKSNLIKEREEYTGKKGKTFRLRLQISSKPENLIKFFSEVGYEYSIKKRYLANVTIAFLIKKIQICKEREDFIQIVKELKGKVSRKSIFERLITENVNQRFIIRSLYELRKTSSRVAFNSLKFNDFLEKRTEGLGKTGQLWAKIVEKEEIDFDDYVYDFTVVNEHHNFVANNLVVSNCGINMLVINKSPKEIKVNLKNLVSAIYKNVPCGVGSKGKLKLNNSQLDEVLVRGLNWAVENGYGTKDDIKHTEENGCMEDADSSSVSEMAKNRGKQQLGTLGAGNHFLEIQNVEEIYDEKFAKKWGLESKDQTTLMLHCGSRGLGHQVASDYLKIHEKCLDKYKIKLLDMQLACAPFESKEGQDYFSAMKCAVNFSFTNRLVMTQWIRDSFKEVFKEDVDIKTVYGICHNIAKIEEINGRKLIVHRKGATRSFPDLPVIIAGSMGTSSYLLKGTK